MQFTFLGATGTVTGSKYLVESGKTKILVDCGLFQGLKELRLRNWAALPIDPQDIDAVVLTHAHIDHAGYIPVFVKHGFRGPIFSTTGTRDLCRILLPDSGRLQEAEYANKKGYSKHRPALPLYTQEDAERSLRAFQALEYETEFAPGPGLTATFTRSGHIIGAACVTLSDGTRSILFSGDLGRLHDPIMVAPETVRSVDYLVVESTYGDRLHDPADPDVVGPTEHGIVPACGAVAAMITAATGVKPYAIGKPNPLMMRLALRQLDVRSQDTVMIGDRMDTDIIAGMESGMETILVLSGVTRREDVERYAYRPSRIAASVAEIALEG